MNLLDCFELVEEKYLKSEYDLELIDLIKITDLIINLLKLKGG